MRWLWVDRFTEFVSGSHAVAIKNVAMDEEVVDKYCPGFPMLPPTLIIEGLAQMGGIMVAEHFDFDKRVVLAKVGSAKYHKPARVGDQLHYRVDLDSTSDAGATVNCKVEVDGQPMAEVDLMFAFLDHGDERFPDGALFKPGDLEVMLRTMNLFNVGINAKGQPIEISSKL